MKNLLLYSYDEKYDILYISKIPNEYSIAEEIVDGIVIRYFWKKRNSQGVQYLILKKD